MSFALVEALYAALEQVGADNDCWVVVLTGAGPRVLLRASTSKTWAAAGHEGMRLPRPAMRAMGYMSSVVPAMRAMPQQPVIAAINGPAYGGGMCMTLGATSASRRSRPCSAAPASTTGSPATSSA